MKNRNVIVILTDSLRFDHLGCYGNRWIKTPHIDKLASQGAIFDNAYAEGIPTLPFRTSAFTGRFTLPFSGWQGPKPSDFLLSEILWNKQCNSAFISDCYHLHEPPHNNFAQGFRNVFWIRGQEHDPYITDPSIEIDPDRYFPVWEYSKYQKKRYHLFQQYLRNTSHWKEEKDTFAGQVCSTAIKWLGSLSGNEKNFLWLDFFDPHAPYDPRFPPYDKMYDTGWGGKKILWIEGAVNEFPEDAIRQMRANYAGEVSQVDRWIGSFLSKVEELGLFDNTLIIYISDHGEPLGEHGIITKIKPWPYEEISHIPLIVKHPEGIGKGERIKSFVQTPDITTTILDFMDIKIPRTFQGKSILPIISGEKKKNYDFAISGFHGQSWSIRNERWSFYSWINTESNFRKPTYDYLRQQLYVFKKNRSELYKQEIGKIVPEPKKYNIEKDMYEKDNIIDKETEIAEEMELALRRFIDTLFTSTIR